LLTNLRRRLQRLESAHPPADRDQSPLFCPTDVQRANALVRLYRVVAWQNYFSAIPARLAAKVEPLELAQAEGRPEAEVEALAQDLLGYAQAAMLEYGSAMLGG